MKFFEKNEYGSRVYDHVPAWKTDVKRIVKEVEALLEQHKPNIRRELSIDERHKMAVNLLTAQQSTEFGRLCQEAEKRL